MPCSLPSRCWRRSSPYRVRASLPAAVGPFAAFALAAFGLHALVAGVSADADPDRAGARLVRRYALRERPLRRGTLRAAHDAADEGGDRGRCYDDNRRGAGFVHEEATERNAKT